jgi:hypothetical protein
MAEYLERFRESLAWWLHGELNWPSPDWEQQLRLFVDHTRYYGLEIAPASIQKLHDLLEARVNGTGPFEVLGPYRWDEPAVATGEPIQLALAVGVDDGTRTDAEPAMHQEIKAGERDFDRMLTEAQGHLDEIVQILESLGARLDAAKLEQDVKVESDVDAIEELIWRYNDAIESAQDTWLRDDLSRDAISRLHQLPSPRGLGLPLFTDELQGQRIMRQGMQISRRLSGRNASMDKLVVGMHAAEVAGNAAGIALGGGVIIAAAKKGGAWAVVKTIALAGAAIAAEQGAEAGLRAAGAGEQTIRGVRLAAIVVSVVIFRRKSGSNAAKPPTGSGPQPAASAARVSPEAAAPIKPPLKPPRRATGRLLRPEEARRKVGQAFNQARKPAYPYNEVPIAKPHGGKPYILDAYDPITGEIVFRRHTQFSEIQFKTAQAYFREFVKKYPPGTVIPDVPTAQGLAGQKLKGQMIFEVPPQWKAIPEAIMDEATRLDIWIRDSNGHVYNPH